MKFSFTLNENSVLLIIRVVLLAYIIGIYQYVSPETRQLLQNNLIQLLLVFVALIYVCNKKYDIAILLLLALYVSSDRTNTAENFNGLCDWESVSSITEDDVVVPKKYNRYIAPIPKSLIYPYSRPEISKMMLSSYGSYGTGIGYEDVSGTVEDLPELVKGSTIPIPNGSTCQEKDCAAGSYCKINTGELAGVCVVGSKPEVVSCPSGEVDDGDLCSVEDNECGSYKCILSDGDLVWKKP